MRPPATTLLKQLAVRLSRASLIFDALMLVRHQFVECQRKTTTALLPVSAGGGLPADPSAEAFAFAKQSLKNRQRDTGGLGTNASAEIVDFIGTVIGVTTGVGSFAQYIWKQPAIQAFIMKNLGKSTCGRCAPTQDERNLTNSETRREDAAQVERLRQALQNRVLHDEESEDEESKDDELVLEEQAAESNIFHEIFHSREEKWVEFFRLHGKFEGKHATAPARMNVTAKMLCETVINLGYAKTREEIEHTRYSPMEKVAELMMLLDTSLDLLSGWTGDYELATADTHMIAHKLDEVEATFADAPDLFEPEEGRDWSMDSQVSQALEDNTIMSDE